MRESVELEILKDKELVRMHYEAMYAQRMRRECAAYAPRMLVICGSVCG